MSTTPTATDWSDGDQFGNAIAAELTLGLSGMRHDVSERLRAARVRAVANRQVVVVRQTVTAGSVVVSGATAALQPSNDFDHPWLRRLGALLPLLALVAGMVVIAIHQDELRVQELAEVDAALLTDELPPAAYVDPGFVQYVRSRQAQQH